MTTVWHNFQANTYSKESSARLFWVSCSKRMLWRFFPRVSLKVEFSSCSRQSETQTKKKERGVVVASPLRSIINDQVEAMREAKWWGDADILYFKNRKLSSSCSLSWKLALIEENPARVPLTWLLQCEQTLLDWSSVCERVKSRSLKSSANFRFVFKTPWRILSKKDSL